MIQQQIMNFLSGTREIEYSFAASCIKYGLEHNIPSNHIKYQIYNSVCPIAFRHKKTGFEKMAELDNKVRQKIKKLVPEDKNTNLYKVTSSYPVDQFIEENELSEKDLHDYIKTYKKELISFASQYKNQKNFLYFSGGIDSELMCNAFLMADVEFTPVIFKLANNAGEYVNDFDTEWAFAFCEDKNITPIVRTMNIEEFWNSNDVFRIALEQKCQSPQICAHYRMIEIINNELAEAKI